jgi:hypothetical protein
VAIGGEWWNELNSKMVIDKPNLKDPQAITGTYHTNVGQAKQRKYPLVGRCGTASTDSQVVGWVVAWDPPDPAKPGETPRKPSLTSWAGQLQRDPKTGEEFLSTTWLLNRTTKASDDWESTIVGVDYFTRYPPTAALLDKAERVGRAARYLKE